MGLEPSKSGVGCMSYWLIIGEGGEGGYERGQVELRFSLMEFGESRLNWTAFDRTCFVCSRPASDGTDRSGTDSASSSQLGYIHQIVKPGTPL